MATLAPTFRCTLDVVSALSPEQREGLQHPDLMPSTHTSDVLLAC